MIASYRHLGRSHTSILRIHEGLEPCRERQQGFSKCRYLPINTAYVHQCYCENYKTVKWHSLRKSDDSWITSSEDPQAAVWPYRGVWDEGSSEDPQAAVWPYRGVWDEGSSEDRQAAVWPYRGVWDEGSSEDRQAAVWPYRGVWGEGSSEDRQAAVWPYRGVWDEGSSGLTKAFKVRMREEIQEIF